ncbi:hypothetical protein [Metabacillus litoralis]|uniref:hypothetical protein n=1 Tax=Metabacillus litoralis TaxID=152268 RepID=UPI001CFF3526|nr:hypothetical protein [Metabacillus litoralis]
MNLGWVGIISVLLIVVCFSYTLNFIENLHNGDKRIAKQSKIVAIICLGLALLIPFVYSLFV